MKVSAKTLKWALRFYPPLFFQRIWVKQFAPDFTSVEVKVHKSVLNTNYNQSIFGGTIFAATDPFYALLFDQLMKARGFNTRVWLKSAQIQYIKPARHHLCFKISLSEEDIAEAVKALTTKGKFVKSFPLEVYDKNGLHCASVINEVYMRNLHHGEHQSIAY